MTIARPSLFLVIWYSLVWVVPCLQNRHVFSRQRLPSEGIYSNGGCPNLQYFRFWRIMNRHRCITALLQLVLYLFVGIWGVAFSSSILLLWTTSRNHLHFPPIWRRKQPFLIHFQLSFPFHFKPFPLVCAGTMSGLGIKRPKNYNDLVGSAYSVLSHRSTCELRSRCRTWCAWICDSVGFVCAVHAVDRISDLRMPSKQFAVLFISHRVGTAEYYGRSGCLSGWRGNLW